MYLFIDRPLDELTVSVSPLCLRCVVQPEELTLLLIKLRRQQAELNSIREHTVAQLMILSMEGPNAKVSTRREHMHSMPLVISRGGVDVPSPCSSRLYEQAMHSSECILCVCSYLCGSVVYG